MRTTTRRPGITLLEVLAAIFIMGVGMLAILVLFPLGALNMARALRDDRLGHIAHNADALATAQDMKAETTVVVPAMVAGQAGMLPPDPSGPSYLAFVDPHYRASGGPANLLSVATAPPQGNIPRLTMPWVTTPPPGYTSQYMLDRYFTMVDDLTFEPDGRTRTPPLERQGYYTWAYLFRRSVTSSPSTTETYVIVYNNRPVQVPGQEPYFDLAAAGNQGVSSVVLNQTNGVMPELRRGAWLLDVSYKPSVTNPTFGRLNGFFYRVIDATKESATQVRVEVEPPLKNDNNYPMTRVVHLEHAVEVFDRGTGR